MRTFYEFRGKYREERGPMNLKRTIGLILVIAGVILAVAKALGGETQSGDWTIRRSDVPGKVEFSLMDSRAGHHFHTSSDWPASDFSGLDFSKAGRQEVHFTIARAAGKFECEGFLHDGEGAGLFHFSADPKYQQEMKSLGFERIDGDKQWAMAIHDVGLKFAQDIKAQNLQGLDTDKLVAFRIHGVSPDFIGQLQKLGYSHPEPEQLIAMRIHGVTPDFITGLQSRGMKDLSIDKLVSLKIHGID